MLLNHPIDVLPDLQAEAAPTEEPTPEAEAAPDSELLHTDTSDLPDGALNEGWSHEGQHHPDGYLQGEGKVTHEDGRSQEGTFEKNKLVQGKRTYSDGSTSEGEHRNELLHGQGKDTRTDGRKWEGEFKDGKPHGAVKFTHHDGSTVDGIFEDGSYSHGTETRTDGTTIVTDSEGNKKTTDPEGLIYERLVDGTHKLTQPDGTQITGYDGSDDATRIRDGKEVKGTWPVGGEFKPNRIRDRIADFLYRPKKQEEEPGTDAPEAEAAPTEETTAATGEPEAEAAPTEKTLGTARELIAELKDEGHSDAEIAKVWGETYSESSTDHTDPNVVHGPELDDPTKHEEFRKKLDGMLQEHKGGTPSDAGEGPPPLPSDAGEGPPPLPSDSPEEQRVSQDTEESSKTLSERLRMLISLSLYLKS